ncbi:MAG: hypothetical protein BWY82_02822 [Verrucomicrobia bacterium ADurb.Bin474]|nr:MAG: hypothetical protein BWY82_02822 [Verrucomicrobia bacterium ADurb.Bin474]
MHLAQRSTQHSEVLSGHVDELTVDAPETGHHSISGDPGFIEPEIRVAMFNESTDFFKGSGIKEILDAFPYREFSFFTLGLQTLLASAHADPGFALAQFLDAFVIQCVLVQCCSGL